MPSNMEFSSAYRDPLLAFAEAMSQWYRRYRDTLSQNCGASVTQLPVDRASPRWILHLLNCATPPPAAKARLEQVAIDPSELRLEGVDNVLILTNSSGLPLGFDVLPGDWASSLGRGEAGQGEGVMATTQRILELLRSSMKAPMYGGLARRPQTLTVSDKKLHRVLSSGEKSLSVLKVALLPEAVGGWVPIDVGPETGSPRPRVFNMRWPPTYYCRCCKKHSFLSQLKPCAGCKAVLFCAGCCPGATLPQAALDSGGHHCCERLSLYMRRGEQLALLPFPYATETTSEDFDIEDFLFKNKLSSGYWLHWSLLVRSPRFQLHSSLEQSKDLWLSDHSEPYGPLKEEANILLSHIPHNSPCLSAPLVSWSQYMSWRGLSLTSPVSVLLSSALSTYYIITSLVPQDCECECVCVCGSACLPVCKELLHSKCEYSPVSLSPVSLSPVSLSPVSLSPVSLSPVSLSPVSLSPLSLSPVSLSPVSLSPVSLSPVSLSPVSLSPVSLSPLSLSPVSLSPVSLSPLSLSPVSLSPVSLSPLSLSPVSLSPVSLSPVSLSPLSLSPVSLSPVSLSPVSLSPVSLSPLSLSPVSLSPVSLSPLSLSPVSLSPVSLSPVSLSPLSLSPVSLSPVSLSPVSLSPVSLSSFPPVPEMNILNKQSLKIHIIESYREFHTLMSFWELSVLLPQMTFELSFIGERLPQKSDKQQLFLQKKSGGVSLVNPAVGSEEKADRRSIRIKVYKRAYHMLLGPKPDLVIGFSPAIPLHDLWLSALPRLQSLRVPAYFCELSELSCESSQQVMSSATGGALSSPALNPFHSPLRICGGDNLLP
ncbi:hypothetical protein P4O66_008532, partial [Electrophorus voltai]